MYTEEALRAMSVPELVGRCAEITARVDQINAKHRPSQSETRELTDLEAEFDQVDARREQIEHRQSQKSRFAGAAGRRSSGAPEIRRMAGSGGEDREGVYDTDRADEHPATVSGRRSQAMRAVDAAVKRRGLPARAAETCERLLSVGPEHETGWMARWIAASGSDSYRSAFAKLLMHGESGAGLRFTPEERSAFERVVALKTEQRAMSLTDTAGGFLVPFELDPAIQLTSAGSINPLMQIATVKQTISDVWRGVSSEGVVAEWLSEADEASDGSPTLAEPVIPSHKMSCFVPFSVEIEGDATSFMAELSALLFDGASQLLNESLTTGSGMGQPTGIVTALVGAGAPVVVPSVGSDAFAAADVFALQNALPARFSANAQWAAHLAVINAARQMETTNGALKFPELGQGQLLNRPINELSNMDGVINAGQNNHTLVYGDFSKYVVTHRVGSSIELIPHLVGANRRPTGQRGLWLWGRYGADAVVRQAFRLLNVT